MRSVYIRDYQIYRTFVELDCPKKKPCKFLVGSSIGKNFHHLSHPYPNLPVTEGAYFSSLFQKDAHTRSLISSRNFEDGHSEVWWKEGDIDR